MVVLTGNYLMDTDKNKKYRKIHNSINWNSINWKN